MLTAPSCDRNGKAVVTGNDLDAPCRTYREQKDGWACQSLRGMGIVRFANLSNVDSRVGSFVLAYQNDDAAETAWKVMVEETRKLVPDAEQQKGFEVGDESQSLVVPAGTRVPQLMGT